MRAESGDDGRRDLTPVCVNDDAVTEMRPVQTRVDALWTTGRDAATKSDQRRARSIAVRNRRPSDASISLPSQSIRMSPFAPVAVPS